MANETIKPATVTGAQNSHGTPAQAGSTSNPCNEPHLKYAVALREFIVAVKAGHRFFKQDEIKAAKRKLSLTELMKRIGDAGFISDASIASPFHPSGRPLFKLYRTRWGIRFTCCGNCGYEGDQIDYLKARFQLATGEAIALFCRLAGIK